MRRAATRSKYGAIRTEVEGITFASKREANRYAELRILERCGVIFHLLCQPVFPIEVVRPTGEVVQVAKYYADFSYVLPDRSTVIEDAKSPGTRTSTYRLKKKLVEAQYGIVIREI